MSNLLLQIDRFPAHGVVITTTNHPGLLDRAVWRRFQLRLGLPRPDERALTRWLRPTCQTLRLAPGAGPPQLARKLLGASFGEVEELGLDLVRRQVVARHDLLGDGGPGRRGEPGEQRDRIASVPSGGLEEAHEGGRSGALR